MALKHLISLQNSFSNKEKKKLDSVIKNKGKASLSSLHTLCTTSKNNKHLEDKAHLYKTIFGSAYSADKDYLLRNEIRNYHNEIKKMLVTSEIENNDLELNTRYAKILSQRKQTELALKTIQKTIKTATKQQHFEWMEALHDSWSHTLYDKPIYKSDFFENLRTVILSTAHKKLLRTNADLATLQFKLSYTEAVLRHLEPGYKERTILQEFTLKDPNYQSSYATYNNLKANTYSLMREEKINVLQNLFERLQKDTFPSHFEVAKEKTVLTSFIATEYMLMGNYLKAIPYFEKCIAGKSNLDELKFYQIVLNFLSCLLKARKIKEAGVFLESEIEIIQSPYIIDRIRPLAIGIYLLNEEITKANALMPQKLKEGNLDAYHYYRVMQALLFIEEDKFDLADNELQNLEKHFATSKNQKFEMDFACSRIILQYVQVEFEPIGDKKKAKQIQLKEAFENYKKTYGEFHGDGILMLWLEKRLQF